jgi:hypothetical protein
MLQLDHFSKQGQAQSGAVGRCSAAAGIRPGLGQGLQERRIHVPPLVNVCAGLAGHGKFSRFLLLWAEVVAGSTLL